MVSSMHFKVSFVAIVALVSCLAPSCAGGERNTANVEHYSIPIGNLLTINVRHEDTSGKDELRLARRSTEMEFVSKMSPAGEPPLLTWRQSIEEELVECSNLRLLDEDRRHYLNCDGALSALVDNHVRRMRLQIRRKSSMIPSTRTDSFIYPLERDYVRSKVEALLAKHSLTDVEFVGSNTLFGYYYELTNGIQGSNKMTCHGEVFISLNQTRNSNLYNEYPLTGSLNELFEHLRYISYGSIVLFPDALCTRKESGLVVTMRTQFMLAHQQLFPYITLEYSSQMFFITELFNFKASVGQTRAEGEDDYNTKITLSLRSIFEWINFNLEHDNVRTNQKFSSGHTRFATAAIAAKVDTVSRDPDDYFVTVADFSSAAGLKEGYESVPDAKFCRLYYEDHKDKAIFNMELDKDKLNSWLSSLMGAKGAIDDIWDEESEDPNNFNTRWFDEL